MKTLLGHARNTFCPGRSASVTSQLSLHRSINPRRGRPRRCRSIFSDTSRPGLSALLTQRLSRGRNSVATVVEVNGFEPMTSCLQSRRSPS
jgi:hypothetical protein